MQAINYLVIVAALTLVHVVVPSAQAAIEVTNEQVRDGLLSLVHSYSQLENKLDRHEQRERALGEIIKRGLQALQKGQKIFDPMQGSYVRLEERVGQIETLLMGLDEKFSEQTKSNKAIENIEKWVNSPSRSSDSDKLTELSNQVEDLSVNVKDLRKEVDELRVKHDGDSQTSRDSFTTIETNLAKKLEENGNVISQIQENLGKIGGARSSGDGSLEDSISKDLQFIKSNIGSSSCGDGNSSGGPIDKDFFVSLTNQTLDAISDMRHEVLTASDKSYAKTTSKLKENAASLDAQIGELLKNTGEGCDGNTLESKQNDVHKLEQMLAQMGDNVLSIKRNMEFNVHAITLEVSEAIKQNSKDLESAIGGKFETINETIWNNHNGAITNLTSKIESEISQVWRQIGIMYQEVSSSKDALNKLQELTTSYVNGTVETMDQMQGKVSQVTRHISEVDENLNYLLGRLQLVMQEFNKVKSGLGTALDDIRNSFQQVHNKIQVVGPGPHKIEPDEDEEIPDIHLLPQRDQPAPN
ncbi:uncharacterized protein LOC129565063 [Sitodiplosis mosellana]|uniref:uncharacterized protein LOC129565063 n=1 Tax=Sitodiplosis mosellana TaxID=263140 RepID=UPI002444DDD8|nr:uncharacterized protein LOC129565063 [Sitodiplosis mosellana]XP_055295396.1 uncharacterized protein LOC129565063 [Sitodiplosis mosellana]